MTTSGSFDFTQTRDEIIKQALELVEGVSESDTPSSDKVNSASAALNTIVKGLHRRGVRIWTIEEVTKTFTAASEVTGTDGKIYTCIKSHVSSSSNRPVTGADYSTYWVVRGSTGGTWVTSTSYTSLGDFDTATDTIGIDSAYVRSGGQDYPIEIINRHEYSDIGNKSDTGRIERIWLENKLSPKIYLYPQVQDITDVLHYSRIRKLEDFDAAGNTPDFPVWWIEPLIYLLAANRSRVYGLPMDRRQEFEIIAQKMLIEAKSTDSDESGFIDSCY